MKNQSLRLLITGGMYYRDRMDVFDALDEIHEDQGIGVVIHAAQMTLKDAGWLAEEWADARGVGVERYPVTQRLDGKWPEAFVKRNARMLETARPDGVVCFPGHVEQDDAASQAALMGLTVWWVAGEPRRQKDLVESILSDYGPVLARL